MSSSENSTVKAFDANTIHSGNFALGIDHEKVERETDALMARMSLAQKINEIHGRQPHPIDALYYARSSSTCPTTGCCSGSSIGCSKMAALS